MIAIGTLLGVKIVPRTIVITIRLDLWNLLLLRAPTQIHFTSRGWPPSDE